MHGAGRVNNQYSCKWFYRPHLWVNRKCSSLIITIKFRLILRYDQTRENYTVWLTVINTVLAVLWSTILILYSAGQKAPLQTKMNLVFPNEILLDRNERLCEIKVILEIH